MVKSRKVNKEERIEIIKYCLEHDMDYKITAKLFETTYANVFNQVKKYKESYIIKTSAQAEGIRT